MCCALVAVDNKMYVLIRSEIYHYNIVNLLVL